MFCETDRVLFILLRYSGIPPQNMYKSHISLIDLFFPKNSCTSGTESGFKHISRFILPYSAEDLTTFFTMNAAMEPHRTRLKPALPFQRLSHAHFMADTKPAL